MNSAALSFSSPYYNSSLRRSTRLFSGRVPSTATGPLVAGEWRRDVAVSKMPPDRQDDRPATKSETLPVTVAPLDILFEDNHCVAVAKPAGVPSTHYEGREETAD